MSKTKKTKRAKTPTGKQKKLAKLMSENIRLGKPRTMYDMMIEAGYSQSMAERQSVVRSQGVQQEMEPIVKQLIAHREKIVIQMKRKLSKAKYRDAVDGLDKVTKNIQLLSGKPTGIEQYHLDDEQKARLDKILNQ